MTEETLHHAAAKGGPHWIMGNAKSRQYIAHTLGRRPEGSALAPGRAPLITYDDIVDYHDPDFVAQALVRNGGPFDIAIDLVGRRSIPSARMPIRSPTTARSGASTATCWITSHASSTAATSRPRRSGTSGSSPRKW